MEKVQFTGTNYDEVKRLCGEKLLAPYFCMGFSMLSLDTGEGFVSVYEGDFIVREDDGTLHIEREDSGRKTNVREHGTCFFELYAQIVLSTFLGREYDDLVNRDRPDLQSPDGRSVGIEVTRAMEESKSAGLAMLMDIAGMTRGEDADDLAQVLENGYSFGLWEGRYVGANELPYWSMALPMRRILESKVGKVSDGFYGRFDRMGLFVFSKDDLGAADALKAMNYTLSLQKYLDNRYDRLYLADVNDLFACNLDDGISAGSRMVRYKISQEQRKKFYLEAIRRQF